MLLKFNIDYIDILEKWQLLTINEISPRKLVFFYSERTLKGEDPKTNILSQISPARYRLGVGLA
jgi:hypothetical protein